MTQTDIEWLQAKRQAWKHFVKTYGHIHTYEKTKEWDTPKFLAIIDEQEREIRRLKTEVARK